MKKIRNLIPFLLALSTAIAILNISPVTGNPDTTLSVMFPNGTNVSINEYAVNEQFNLKIYVTSVIDLYGYDFTLKYDPSVLTANTVTIGSFLLPIYQIWKNEINEAAGTVWFAASQGIIEIPPPPHPEPKGVTGSGTLATISFTVNSVSPSILVLSNSKLSNSLSKPIAATTIVGFFQNPPERIALALDTGFLEEHRWIYTKDEDKLITFQAHIKDMDIGVTYARVRFTVLDAEGFPIWETLSEDVLATEQGQQFRIFASYSPAQLINHFLYDIVFTLEYIDASGTWSVGHKGSPTGNQMMMTKSFTVEGLP